MENKDEEMKTEQNNEPEAPETLETPEEEPTQPEAPEESQPEAEPTPPEKPEKKPQSKFVRFLIKAGIGLGIVVVIFFAGFLTDHFTRYRPLSETLEQTRAELDQAKLDLSELQDENDALTSANTAAEEKIAELEEALESAEANALFYQVLVDANTAQLELFLEDIEGAQAALTETQTNLEELLPFITEVDTDLARSLPNRLDLIIAGLVRDPETARIDLSLLTKDLLELEPLLTGE